MTTAVTGYLGYAVTFSLGSETVRLAGVLSVGNGEARFAVGQNVVGFPPAVLAQGTTTTEIKDPLGLTGLSLRRLEATGRVHRGAGGSTTVDLAVGGEVVFASPALSRFTLRGAVVVVAGTARLAVVELSATPPFTLTELLGELIGTGAELAKSLTDELAFVGGQLYWLERPPGAPADYKFSYALDPAAPPVTFIPGYNVEGTLRLFGHDFEVTLGVDGGVAHLVTTTAEPIDFFFIRLDHPLVEVRTGANPLARVRTEVAVLDTPITGAVEAAYDSRQDAFMGEVSTRAAGLDLDVKFKWARGVDGQGHLTVTDINGLSAASVTNLVDQFTRVLNQPGGCEKLLTDWLAGLGAIQFKPALNGSPTRQGSDRMMVPLKLDYSLGVGDHRVNASIPFRAVLAIPSSLDGLPLAIAESIGSSAATIAADLLRDPDTYAAILWEVARRGGAQAFARAICRALREALEDLAKGLADAAEAVVAETLAAAAELAAQLILVSLLGLNAIVSLFEELWDEIKDLFGGGDGKKREAEEKLSDSRRAVESAIAKVDERIDDVRARIAPVALATSLDDSRLTSEVTWGPRVEPTGPDDGSGALGIDLAYLTGDPGDPAGAVLLDVTSPTLPDVRPLSAVASHGDFRMNARIQTRLTGYTYMDATARGQITSAASQFGAVDDDVARDFAGYLDSVVQRFDDLNEHGVASDPVYATTTVPTVMTIGRSRIGFNTRVTA